MSIEAKDHLGHKFKSISAMCRFWNIKVGLVFDRLERGLSIKDALTTAVRAGRSVQIKDYLGHEFSSIQKMCSAHNIKYKTFYRRLKRGLSLKEALSNKKEGNHYENRI